MTEAPLPSLLDQPLDQWPELVTSLGEPSYRAPQLVDWIFKKRADSFSDFSTLPKKFRDQLSATYSVRSLGVDRVSESKIDGTSRFFFHTKAGESVSCVYLPFEKRSSLCLSTQVGCAWGCVFCASGKVAFERNLTPSEIVDQIFYVEKITGQKLNSLLFMGMGEPLANFRNLTAALHMIRSPMGLGFGARHVTVSTCGLVPQIEALADEAPKVNLAISLHAADDELRKKLLPKSSKWTIKELIHATKNFSKKTKTRVTFEYILLKGVNDSEREAKRLANLVRGFVQYGDYWINLIVYNPVPGLPYEKPDMSDVEKFKEILTARHISVRLRKPQGVDIEAGCGQLGEAT